jgi:hypothetical protein
MLQLIRRRAALFLVGLVAALAPMLMAPSGGFPSRPLFQSVAISSTTGVTCPGGADTAHLCVNNNTPGHTAWSQVIRPAGGAGNILGLYIAGPTANSTDTLFRVDTAAGTTFRIAGDGTMTGATPAPIVCTGTGAPCSLTGMVIGQSAFITKTAATTRNTTTTLTVDPDLQFSNMPIGVYNIEGMIAGFGQPAKYSWGSLPGCGASVSISRVYMTAQQSATLVSISITANPLSEAASSLGGPVAGTVGYNGAGNNTQGFCWTQAASNASNTGVDLMSYLQITRLQ